MPVNGKTMQYSKTGFFNFVKYDGLAKLLSYSCSNRCLQNSIWHYFHYYLHCI